MALLESWMRKVRLLSELNHAVKTSGMARDFVRSVLMQSGAASSLGFAGADGDGRSLPERSRGRFLSRFGFNSAFHVMLDRTAPRNSFPRRTHASESWRND